MTDLREQEMQSQIDALSSTAENWKNTAKNWHSIRMCGDLTLPIPYDH